MAGKISFPLSSASTRFPSTSDGPSMTPMVRWNCGSATAYKCCSRRSICLSPRPRFTTSTTTASVAATVPAMVRAYFGSFISLAAARAEATVRERSRRGLDGRTAGTRWREVTRAARFAAANSRQPSPGWNVAHLYPPSMLRANARRAARGPLCSVVAVEIESSSQKKRRQRCLASSLADHRGNDLQVWVTFSRVARERCR